MTVDAGFTDEARMRTERCCPVLKIPQAWRRITHIHLRLDVACPEASTPLDELNEWIDWWSPAFECSEGLSQASMSRMRSTGWWPPYVLRACRAPKVVADSRQGLLYWDSKRRIDDRSRAYHRAIGDLLESNLDWIERARARAAKGAADHKADGVIDSPLDHWIRILSYPLEHVIETISYDSERMNYLRPYSPFTGALPQSIRIDILNAFSKPKADKFAESETEMST